MKKTCKRGDRKVPPVHPGAFLREDYLPGCRMSMTGFARALGVSRQTVNEILREKRALTAPMALRLSRLFGTTPEFWLSFQQAHDLWEAEKRMGKRLDGIRRVTEEDLASAVADGRCRYGYKSDGGE